MIKSGYYFSGYELIDWKLRTLLPEELFFISNFLRFLGKVLVKVSPMIKTEDPMTLAD